MSEQIEIKRLDSGYWRAQGNGPCEWAQWPTDRELQASDFFPEASHKFRRELQKQLREEAAAPARERKEEG